jgi:GH15 family glucan-1,4-alpha-glucosidase
MPAEPQVPSIEMGALFASGSAIVPAKARLPHRPTNMALRIEDYALIGDCHTGALVGNDGSIDWLCLPRFSSDACFASLLGKPEHGYWKIAPKVPFRAKRRYRGDSLILETEFETDDGAVRLIDGMSPWSEGTDLVRVVEGKRGRVPMKMELVLRPDYGSIVPWVRRTERGIKAIAGPDAYLLDTPVELHGENLSTVAEFNVAAGECVPLTMLWHPSHEDDPPPIDAKETLDKTEKWWCDWAAHNKYDGPWRDAVMRSLITLKALTFKPTGGIVAAATTSLPEQLGGARNWDYRYCWVRDATFALLSLLHNGFTDEAAAWADWLLRAVAGDPAQMNIMYGLAGERRLPELELEWLPGYENSKPVRIGNAAHRQFQLDVFGELMDALHLARKSGIELNENAWRVQQLLMEFLETAWVKPDDGIWEIRGPRRHFTHSKVMAWVAVDRMIRSAKRFQLDGPVDKWKKLRQTIHDEVCARGFNTKRNAFVQVYEGTALDASLLMLPLVGFLPADDPRIRGTVDAIERELVVDGFAKRYATRVDLDGLPIGEGTFLVCTFWFIDNLILLGRKDQALEMFERMLELRNDVGLLAEEYDTTAKRQVGNFPQAFSHVGLVNTARNLTEAHCAAEERSSKNGDEH